MTPHVRDYCPEDFEELWRLDQECFPPGIAYSRLELMHYIRRRGVVALVAEEDGAVRGFAVAERKPSRGRSGESKPDVGHVITIDVRESARRHRVGTVLMDALESRLHHAGCEVVYLETAVDNLAAITFYKRRGYGVLKTVPRYYENKLDALLMGKKLV